MATGHMGIHRRKKARRCACAKHEGIENETGFGLVELVVSVAVLMIFATAFIMTVIASVRTQVTTRNKVLAEQLATQKIEQARALSYTNLGTVSGNPSGTIPTSTTASIGSIPYTVATSVAYVDDPLPSGFESYANYKKITVTVSKGGKQYAQLSTNVAPPTPPQQNKAVVKVKVIDYGNNQPIAGATVSLNDGPSSPLSGTSASDGQVIFPGLTPNPASGATQYYNVTVSYAGYQTLPEDLPNASAAHFQVAVSQVRVTSIRMFKPVILTLNAVDAGGTLLSAASGNFYVYSSRQVASVPFTGGKATITTLNGEAIIPGLQYEVGAVSGTLYGADQAKTIPLNYPSSSTDSFNIVMTNYATSALLSVTVKNSSNNPLSNQIVMISDGPGNVFFVGRTNGSGVLAFTVPTHATTKYTVTYPPQGTRPLKEVMVAVPGPGTTSVNLSV